MCCCYGGRANLISSYRSSFFVFFSFSVYSAVHTLGLRNDSHILDTAPYVALCWHGEDNMLSIGWRSLIHARASTVTESTLISASEPHHTHTHTRPHPHKHVRAQATLTLTPPPTTYTTCTASASSLVFSLNPFTFLSLSRLRHSLCQCCHGN